MNLTEKNVAHIFFENLVIITLVQFAQGVFRLPYYDIFYLLLLLVILTASEISPRLRILGFSTVFFFLDVSPGFIILPIAVYFCRVRNIIIRNQTLSIKKFVEKTNSAF